MARIATLADLAALLYRVPLPDLSAERGEPVEVVVRRIHARELLVCLPSRLPPRAEAWTPATAPTLEAEWLGAMSEEERWDAQRDLLRATARVVAMGCVEPPLTWREAERLSAADAEAVQTAILAHSGLTPRPTNGAAAPPPAAAPAPDAP